MNTYLLLRRLYPSSPKHLHRLFCTTTTATASTDSPSTPTDVFLHWGCTDTQVSQIISRRPALLKSDPDLLLSKLSNLRQLLHLSPSHLVSILNRRPRFLSYRLPLHHLPSLLSLFGSPSLLLKAVVLNPSLLFYDFPSQVSPILSLYSNLGISRPDLLSMLLYRPTLIPRSNLCPDKLDFISRINLPRHSKMFKYIVATIAVSRLDTLRDKLSHFMKFGFSEDDVLAAIGRSPQLLTLSTDKVQRNMTFVVGILKLPARTALDHPFLLYFNLETSLKPRMSLAGNIAEMGIEPRIEADVLLTALRMSEKRFINRFIDCHPVEVREELMRFYIDAKGVKRLAVSSKKKNSVKGLFPF